MPLKISKTLLNKLPKDEKADIEDYLWKKAGGRDNGRCYLCDEPLNESSDEIVPDHDVPDSEGGKTDRDNLNLAHQSCNAAKRNAPSVDVRPYLRLRARMVKHGAVLKYGDVLRHFEIEPAATSISEKDSKIVFNFPDGSKRTQDVITETNQRRTYRYAFVDVPARAIFNDEQCQPRALKLSHVWAIYSDLQRNPLHEPPGCRLDPTGDGGLARILMFDGQHKSVATWMAGRERIAVKVYLDLDAKQAIELVNSVQAKIRKLPLSPFELAAKMADEWSNKMTEYESAVGGDEASEKGFIDWLPPAERARAKQAFKSALIQDVLADTSLTFRKYIAAPTGPLSQYVVTENAFKTKVLEQMLELNPLDEKGDAASAARSRERNNVITALNLLVQFAFEPETEVQKERMRRMMYQASLATIASVLKETYKFALYAGDHPFIERVPTMEELARIQKAIKALVEHPVWTTPFTHSQKMRRVEEAMSKNQNITKSFKAVDFTGGALFGKVAADCVDD